MKLYTEEVGNIKSLTYLFKEKDYSIYTVYYEEPYGYFVEIFPEAYEFISNQIVNWIYTEL